jgi:hypothetical protein
MARDALIRKKIGIQRGTVISQGEHTPASNNKAHHRPQRPCLYRRLAKPNILSADYVFHYFLDRYGRQHFNFRQHIWLDPGIQMAYTPIRTIALDTLAINLLTFEVHDRAGFTSQRAIELIAPFCTECLLTSPRNAWLLPRATIKAWADSHRSVKRSQARGTHKRAMIR